MADLGAAKNGPAVAFMVSAGLVYEIIAAACSSPQTAEINASTRSATLMKWVRLGLVQAAIFVAIAAIMDHKRALPILGGGTLAGVVLSLCYYHANASGLRTAQAGTEQ